MTRYIDADALGIGRADRNAFVVPEYADGWNSAIDIIANAPTAVVVPRAEVEVYKNALSKSNEYMERTKKLFEEESQNTKRAIEIINKWEEKYKTAKQEVAREIFEEIEKLTASVYNDFMFNREGVGIRATIVVEFSDELDLAIAELKKKYTEGE